MYRLTRKTPLSTGQKYGDIIRDGDLSKDTINRMLQSGTLVRVSTPPLSELPEWEERAGQLAGIGVITISDLEKADSRLLARQLRKSARTIDQWKNDALDYLKIPNSSND